MTSEKNIRRSMSERLRHSSIRLRQKSNTNEMPDIVPERTDEDSALNRSGQLETVKCTVIGDGAIGKTSLIVSYTTNDYPEDYKPTVHDFYTVRLTVADKPITFQLFDTAGQEQFNVIRRLAYPQTNIFLLCFNLVDQISFQNVKEKWVPELREFAPKIPIILVGLQSDERNVHPMKWSQGSQKSKPIKTEEGELLARKIGAKKYMECSACTQKNVKNVFDTAVMTVLEQQERKERSHGNSLRASFRRLSKRRGLSRSTSDTSSCSRSSTGTYRTTKASERSSTSSSSLFNISITESLRDIFCFG